MGFQSISSTHPIGHYNQIGLTKCKTKNSKQALKVLISTKTPKSLKQMAQKKRIFFKNAQHFSKCQKKGYVPQEQVGSSSHSDVCVKSRVYCSVVYSVQYSTAGVNIPTRSTRLSRRQSGQIQTIFTRKNGIICQSLSNLSRQIVQNCLNK